MKKLVFVLICGLLGMVFLGDVSACSYYDYSDAPGYGTAKHKIRSSTTSWQWFGSGVDNEWFPGCDPEDDGFSFSTFVPGESAWVNFTAHSRRRAGVYEQIRVWIDWNQNKTFEASECIKHQAWKVPKRNKTLNEYVYFTVPTYAILGTTWLRARICCQNHLSPTGYRNQGEVEDHQIDVVPEPATICMLFSFGAGLFAVKKRTKR